MDDVVAWVIDPEGTEIAVVIGRGGLGKSKLLWEVASRAEGADVHLRFLAVGQQPVASDFDHLPRTGSLVVVLDDAHAIDRVAGIISQLWQSRPGARVLLATRPYGKVELDAEIWRLNQAPRTTAAMGAARPHPRRSGRTGSRPDVASAAAIRSRSSSPR